MALARSRTGCAISRYQFPGRARVRPQITVAVANVLVAAAGLPEQESHRRFHTDPRLAALSLYRRAFDAQAAIVAFADQRNQQARVRVRVGNLAMLQANLAIGRQIEQAAGRQQNREPDRYQQPAANSPRQTFFPQSYNIARRIAGACVDRLAQTFSAQS